MTTAARIVRLLEKDFKIDPETLRPDARLEDMGVDSIGMAELLFAIEDEFALKLPDVPMDLANFDDVVRFVDRKISEQAASAPLPGAMADGASPPP